MTTVNKRLSRSNLFRNRLANSTFGVYREFENSFWEPIRCQRLELGYTSVEDQIQFLGEKSDTEFYLQVDGREVDWTVHLHSLAALENVRGLGGAGIRQDEFLAFPELEWVFLGEDCPDFDASQFPRLKYLQGSFDEGDRGVSDASWLISLSMSFSLRTKFDFSHISSLSELEALRVVYGKMEDTTQISALENLRTLDLDSAMQLRSVDGLECLKNVSTLRVSQGKSVSNWRPIAHMSSIETLKLYDCGEVILPAEVMELPAFAIESFPNCKVSFV